MSGDGFRIGGVAQVKELFLFGTKVGLRQLGCIMGGGGIFGPGTVEVLLDFEGVLVGDHFDEAFFWADEVEQGLHFLSVDGGGTVVFVEALLGLLGNLEEIFLGLAGHVLNCLPLVD